MLYLTGGLVLGETMALFVTAEQGFFGLAAMLPVFSCAFFHGSWRGAEKGGRRPPVSFFLVSALLFGGLCTGFFRMELEEHERKREENLAASWEREEISLYGTVEEISESGYGFRLLLVRCEGEVENAREKGGEQGTIPGRMYCYVDSDTGIRIGTRLFVRGEGMAAEPGRNPGAFDYRQYCRSKGIGGILSAEEIQAVDFRYDRFREGIRQIRLCLERQLDRIAADADIGILKAVLLGNRSDMDEEVYELYRKNGISHLLAISGLHISIIGTGLWKGLRRCGMGYGGAGAVSFGILVCYGILTGFGPSVVRAMFMSGLSFLAAFLGRTYDLPSAMCVPALYLLLHRPYLITQPSFQLSFMAVGAVFYPGAHLKKILKAKGLHNSVLVSASIQIMTAPAILYHSFELPVYSVFLNVLVIPLMTYVVVSGILGLILSLFIGEAGAAFLGGAHYILRFYEYAGRFAGALPGAVTVPGRPGFWQIFLFYAGVLAGTAAAGREWWRKGQKWLLFWLIGFLFLLPLPERGLTVTFLDVGQGDGIFLQANGKTMLVDCGSSQKKSLGEDCLVPFLKSRGISRVDTIVVTHGDMDHISGIRSLLSEPDFGIRAGTLIMPETGQRDPVYGELEECAKRRGTQVVYKNRGDDFGTILGKGISVSCLHPPEDCAYTDRNEESLVLRVQYKNFSLLLTGDVGASGEKEILSFGKPGPATVLKAGHHGSSTSSGEEFLRAVRPKYAVLSYGEGNRYGHPSPEVRERLEAEGTEILETARMGAITLWTDGETMDISGWLDRPDGI